MAALLLRPGKLLTGAQHHGHQPHTVPFPGTLQHLLLGAPTTASLWVVVAATKCKLTQPWVVASIASSPVVPRPEHYIKLE